MARALDYVDVLQKELLALQPIDNERQQKIDKKFRLEFNYNSNHMEGNTLTYGETELLLIFEDTTGNHSIREYDEMRNHDVAFKLVEDWARDKEHVLTEQNIKNLNEIILVRPFWKEAITPDGQPTRRLIKIGNYKEFPNSVRLQSGEIFNYTSPTDTPIEMANLIGWYRTEGKGLHPVALAAMLHYKFVRIHPFDDGNGRVARLLMNYVLLRYSFPPVVIKSNDKTNYLRVLHLADVEDYQPLIEYVAEQLIWSQQIVIRGAKGESIDEAGDFEKRVKYIKSRLNTDENTQVQVRKSTTSIATAWEKSILPLLYNVEGAISKLSVLFKSTAEQLILSFPNSPPYQAPAGDVEKILTHATNELIQIEFRYALTELRDSNELSISIWSAFVFHTNVYEIISNGLKHPISKLYNESFTVEETEFIADSLGNFLATAIEKHLDGNRNRQK